MIFQLLLLAATCSAHWQSQHHDSRNSRQADAQFNMAAWPSDSTLVTTSRASSSDVTCSGVSVDATGAVWTMVNYGNFGTRTTVLKYAANGTLACRLDVPSAQKSGFSYVTGVSPISLNADSSLAFFAMEYSLFAVTTSNCALAWNVTVADDAFSVMSSRDGFTCAAPNVDVATGLLYVNGQRMVHAFDPVKRLRVWTGFNVGDPSEPVARDRPASCNGLVFVTAVNTFHLQHTIAALSAVNGSTVWNVTVKTSGFSPFVSNIVVDKACAVVYVNTKQGLARYAATTGAPVATQPTPNAAAGAKSIVLMSVGQDTTLVSLSNDASASGLMASPVTSGGANWFIKTRYATEIKPIASSDGTVLFCPENYLVVVSLAGKNTTLPVSCSYALTLDSDQQVLIGPQQFVVVKATTTTTTSTAATTAKTSTAASGGGSTTTTAVGQTTITVGTDPASKPRGDVSCGQVALGKACKERFFQATYTFPKDTQGEGHAAVQQYLDVLPSGSNNVAWTGGVADDCVSLSKPFFKCAADSDFGGPSNRIACPPHGVSMNGDSLGSQQIFVKITPPAGATDCSGVVQLSISPILDGNGTCTAPLKEVDSCGGSSHGGSSSANNDGGNIWAIPRGIGFIAACAAGGFCLLICLPGIIIACICFRKKGKNSQHVALLEESAGDVPQVYKR